MHGWLAPALGTLKFRLALGSLAGLVAAMAVTLWQFGESAQHELLVQVRLHEQRETQLAAEAVGQRLLTMQRALALVAGRLDAPALADEARLRELLQGQTALRELFSAVFVADGAGQLRLLVDAGGARRPQVSVADRAWFQRALGERRPVLSEAIPSRVSDEPVVVLALPVDLPGAGIAVLGGALRLASHDLLRLLALPPAAHTPAAQAAREPRMLSLAGSAQQVPAAAVAADARGANDDGGRVPQGHSRYADGWRAGADAGSTPLVVITDAMGRILSHPLRGRLLTALADEPRFSAAFRAGLAGGDAASRLAAIRGDDDVVTSALDPVSGWRIWRAVPRQQLLAGMQSARSLALRDALLLAALTAAALLAFMAWQLQPLTQLERRAADLLSGRTGADWPEGSGEIGRLARTLRHVWAERAQIEAFNAEVLGKLGSVMAAAPVGLAFTREGRFEIVGDELCRLLGHERGGLVGQPTRSIFAADDDWKRLGGEVATAFGLGQVYQGEWRLQRADGSRLWGRLRARPVRPGDAAAGTIWSAADVSEEVAARDALQHAAHHDALTGLVNRQGFEQALRRLHGAGPAARPAARPAALVMIDLDHFKPINDNAGHAAGDAMLVAVARAITSRVRGSDLVVRLGGDEFAVLLPGCDRARAMAIAEKVREAIAALSVDWQGRTLRVGASLGVAELADQHADPAQWLSQADAACYEAKRAGRGTVRLARPGLKLLAGG